MIPSFYLGLSRRTGATAAGIFGVALASVLLLCGAGSVPIENFSPQGPMQSDLNAGGHGITNAALMQATNVNAQVLSGAATNQFDSNGAAAAVASASLPSSGTGVSYYVQPTAGSATVTLSSTSGIVVGQKVTCGMDFFAAGTTVVSLVANTSVTLSNAATTAYCSLLPIPMIFGNPPVISIPGPDGTGMLILSGGLRDLGGYGGQGDVVFQNNNALGNVFDVQNLDSQGFSAIVGRDSSGYDQWALGEGNPSTGSYFNNRNYWESANGTSSPFPIDIDIDGPYGNYGSGARFYRRLTLTPNGATVLYKSTPYNGWTVTGNTHSTVLVDSVSNIAGIFVGAPVTGSGIPSGDTVAAITGSSFALAAPATTSLSATTLTIGYEVQAKQAQFSDTAAEINEPLTINTTTDNVSLITLNNNEYRGGGALPTTGISFAENGTVLGAINEYNGNLNFYGPLYFNALAAGGLVKSTGGVLGIGVAGTDYQAAGAYQKIGVTTYTATGASPTVTVDLSLGDGAIIDLTGATGTPVIAFSNGAAGSSCLLKMIQGTTALNCTLPTGTIQAGGGGTTYTASGASAVDAIAVQFTDSTHAMVAVQPNFQ